ncbi:hypothetical protein [Microbacterium aurantiacum]|uniref:hypothetical protein n=1 Tax=Microbacterium aurantiacum TaxID=162393 RepID=UPI000C7FB674|nr:hypothetical protein [Microbacterium aurantiacum]
MRQRPKVGDVFLIPAGEGSVGIGQVAATYGKDAYFLAVFDGIVAEEDAVSRLRDALAGEVLFFGLSLDAKFYVGHWQIVSNLPVRADLPFPAYKETVMSPDRIDAVDYSGLRRRPASKDEVGGLSYRTIVAPVRFERALRASIGLDPWLPAYEELKPHKFLSRDLFG